MERTFIFDFDSTITQVEAFDELAAISLRKHPQREHIIAEIKDITNQGMEGKIPVTESLRKRIVLLHATMADVDQLVRLLKRKITPSLLRNKVFFKRERKHVYVVSNGFREFIVPVVKELGISGDHIFANTLVTDEHGVIIGYDQHNLLAQENGKALQLKALHLPGEVCVIGDGYTDYLAKAEGAGTKFFAFTENAARQQVMQKADHIVPSFDEFLYINRLPVSLSYPKNRIKVLLLENIHPRAVDVFKHEGYTIESAISKSLSEAELKEKLQDVFIVGIRSKTKITEQILKAAPRLLSVHSA